MYSNVGLTTPRGSGTSGYIQRNLSTLKPRDTGTGAPYPPKPTKPSSSSSSSSAPNPGNNSTFPPSDSNFDPTHLRTPDQAILQHDRLRDIEMRVFELRSRLEDENENNNNKKEGEEESTRAPEMTSDEIEKRCDDLRDGLIREMEMGRKSTNKGRNGAKGSQNAAGAAGRSLKPHQVHELAEAKLEESERLRRALGIRDRGGGGGGW